MNVCLKAREPGMPGSLDADTASGQFFKLTHWQETNSLFQILALP